VCCVTVGVKVEEGVATGVLSSGAGVGDCVGVGVGVCIGDAGVGLLKELVHELSAPALQDVAFQAEP